MLPPPEPTASFPYRILTKVGEGGMGAVYRARDLELGRDVAIKVIKPEHLSSLRGPAVRVAVERFLQEARAAAALSHPGATTVHRIGMEDGWPYIAMEWLDGRNLEELLAEEPQRFSVPRAVRIAIDVLEVLEVAHAAGVVHRDIKPSNLMLIANGRIKLTDFGIARVRGSKVAHTQIGMILGTPQYAAPEQLQGRETDCRVDLYAVGSVLYEMIVGRPPFEAPTLYELIHAVHATPPMPPSSLAPGVSPALDQVLGKALAKRPEDRFAGAADMIAALLPLASSAAASAPVGAVAEPGSSSVVTGVPTLVAEGAAAHQLVVSVVRSWPATALGRQVTSSLLERVTERPLHAAAFCGALDAGGTYLLICEGLIFAAFDPSSGRSGDAAIEAMPEEVDATLLAVPADRDPRGPALLASLLATPQPRLSSLDASIVDLGQLGRKLAAEGFDGALRLVRGDALGFALFSRGQRIVDVFGGGWPVSPRERRWEEWIAGSGATASVEPIQRAFPSVTFRRQLRDLSLEVVRPEVLESSSVRSDTRAAAQSLQLRARAASGEAVQPGESALHALVEADPICDAARWVLTALAPEFIRYGRARRWKGLIEPLARVREVRLHHAADLTTADRFDAATYGDDRKLQHVIERVALGTKAAVDRFVARAISLKTARGHTELGGAILIAPRFEEAALASYLEALRLASKHSVFSGLDALSHKEGFVRTGARSGLHVLLVEEVEGERRPLVFE